MWWISRYVSLKNKIWWGAGDSSYTCCLCNSVRQSEYGGGHPNIAHFKQKKSQCLPNCATTPTTYDNSLITEIAR